MSIKLEVWGDYALFTRPEMKAERVSYDIITPSAARGLIEAIYWHPGMRWHIDRIHVCAPIRFTNLRRNEVKSTISARNARTVMERGTGELYLCTSEDIRLCEALPSCPEELKGKRDLGWMLYDMDYTHPENITPLFFRGILEDGVLEVPPFDSEEVRR